MAIMIREYDGFDLSREAKNAASASKKSKPKKSKPTATPMKTPKKPD